MPRTAASAPASVRAPRWRWGSRSTPSACRRSSSPPSSAGKVDLDDPATTVALLELERGRRRHRLLRRTGKLRRWASSARCATRLSTTRSRPASGDAWTAGPTATSTSARSSRSRRACSRSSICSGVDEATVRAVLNSWGPGKFDAELVLDGKAFRPDGKLGRDADPAGLRPGRREPAHLDGLGLGHALERVRRQPRDARQGHVLRPAARRRRASFRSRRAPASATFATSPT